MKIKNLPPDKVIDLIDSYADIQTVLESMSKAFETAFGDAERKKLTEGSEEKFSIINAMKLATSMGISVTEFWEITPYELSIFAESYLERKEIESEERILQAYLTALWSRTKKMPNINKILKREKRK